MTKPTTLGGLSRQQHSDDHNQEQEDHEPSRAAEQKSEDAAEENPGHTRTCSGSTSVHPQLTHGFPHLRMVCAAANVLVLQLRAEALSPSLRLWRVSWKHLLDGTGLPR